MKQQPLPFPKNQDEMAALGWAEPDFILVTGDAFVDHSSCGAAIIARVLNAHGYRVGVISQPRWQGPEEIKALGPPRLGFLVTAGNLDSMVNHYTVNKKKRHDDAYSAGGVPGKRPNRAIITYCSLIRYAFPGCPIIIGGIEASLRRFAHYDYWQDGVRRPILYDCQGDLVVYGMVEKAILEVAEALKAGLPVDALTYIRGTGCLVTEKPQEGIFLPSFAQVAGDKQAFAQGAALIQGSNDPFCEEPYIQEVDGVYFMQNPPQMPLTEMEMDDIYDLPYTGRLLGGGSPVPSFEEVKFSVTANRGCFGSCAFCALAIHQGRYMQRRSKASILGEIKKMTQMSDFKGYIHDIGGPTANFRNPACEKQTTSGVCRHRECLFPTPCKNLDCDERAYCDILKEARQIPGVKKVFVRSGIRYDYLLKDKESGLLKELVKYHISGQLRVAPEHLGNTVLSAMGKPAFEVYEAFVARFEAMNRKLGMEQYIVPYFISSHPGSTLQDAVALSVYFKAHRMIPEQVQDFYPTPGSLATAMYYTGIDPRTMAPIYVPKGREKNLQRALLQFNNPKNKALVREALIKAGRQDLMGPGKDALIWAPPSKGPKNPQKGRKTPPRGKRR